MPEPIVFISHSRVKPGKLDSWKASLRENTPRLEAEKPRTLVFLAYLDDDEEEMTIFHIFADAESMDAHMEGVAERSGKAFEYIETLGFEVYGRPREDVLEMLRRAPTSGIGLTVDPEYVVGFLRPGPG